MFLVQIRTFCGSQVNKKFTLNSQYFSFFQANINFFLTRSRQLNTHFNPISTMLNLKSYYRFNSQIPSDYQSTTSNQSQWVTAGICDYIPYSYFLRQYFSVYIQALDPNQIIQSILWNQFYEKTLLKQIHAQMSNLKNHETNLISKIDKMVSKVPQMPQFPSNSQSNTNQIIYLKVHNKIFNLKDKLEFQSCAELEKDIKIHKCLYIQKISKQGKWNKVYIEFGPYKNKSQFDIVFTATQNEQNLKLIHQQNIVIKPIDKKKQLMSNNNDLRTTNSTKQSNKIISKKQSIKAQIKQSKIVQNSSVKNKQNKQLSCYPTATKSISKSKISYPHSLISSVKKNQGNQSQQKKKFRQNSTGRKENNETNIKQSQGRKSMELGSVRKAFNNFQGAQSDINILKEMNFNSTAKLSNHLPNFNEEDLMIPPCSLDLRRKQKIKAKQNSIMESEVRNQLIEQSQILKSYKDLGKNNSVLAQILSKKQQTIHFQRMKMQEMQKRHTKQIEQLRLRHQKQTQGFKTEISSVLGQYNKKYEAEKDQTKKLRQEVAFLNQVTTNNKVSMAQLQLKFKSTEDQCLRQQKESQELKNKIKQMESNYTTLLYESKQQYSRLTQQKQQRQQLADKYLQKYNNIYKKMKLFLQQEDN